MPSFSAERFVFQSAIQKYNGYNIQSYNFVRCFVWVWSLVSHNAGGILAEGVWQQGTMENIWVWEWEGNRKVEKTVEQRALWSVLNADYYSGDHIKKNETGKACGMPSR